MSMEKTLTLAEALRELKRVDKLLQQRYVIIRRYSSKKKGSTDEITNQKNYVSEQYQSARDLLTYYTQIKLMLNQANLTASFEYNGVKYTIAEAILYKHYLNEEYTKLYDSFTPENALRQLQALRVQTSVPLTPEQLVAINLVPELYYNEKTIQKRKEDLLGLMSMIDAHIDRTNHNTTITVTSS